MQHVRPKLKPRQNQCLRLTIAYDGTKYSGWAEQRNAKTVMGELREAIEPVVKAQIEMAGAGRTDAGVHARGQVAHIKWDGKPVNEQFLVAQANLKLPADIALVAAAKAPLAFHARHDAVGREYVYQIATHKTAFDKKFVWWIKAPLDTTAMQRAAATLVGRHDFKCFQAQDAGRPNESSIVVVDHAAIEIGADRLLFRISASHFVWRMVRRLTGVLVKIGLGEISEDDLQLLLKGKPIDRLDVAAWTAPSSGLFFEKVSYR